MTRTNFLILKTDKPLVRFINIKERTKINKVRNEEEKLQLLSQRY